MKPCACAILRKLLCCFSATPSAEQACAKPVEKTGPCDGDVLVLVKPDVPGTKELQIDLSRYSLVVPHDLTLNEAVCVTQDVAVLGKLTFDGTLDTCVTGNVLVTGDVIVAGAICVTGNVIIDGDVTATGDICVTGNAFVRGNVTIHGKVDVGGSFTVWGSKTIQPVTPQD